MASTTPQDDPASHIITRSTLSPMNIDTSGIHDVHLCQDGGDDDTSTLTSSSMYGVTILSSLAPSSLTQSFPETHANSGTVHVPISSSLALSINPSMVDSSVIIPTRSELRQAALSQSSISSDDISSCDDSHSSRYDPQLFVNIGRSLMLASASSASKAYSDDGRDSLTKPSEVTGSAKGVKWWDQLQTNEDWDRFRASARVYLKALVIEETREMKRKSISNNRSSVDERWVAKDGAHQNGKSLYSVGQWLQGLYAMITASTVGVDSDKRSTKTKYTLSLVKEIADIQQQLDRLPPAPPTLPDELPLDDLPRESRDLLVQYRERLDAWRGEVMPHREELSAKYVRCQEKLLAAIIDAEEAHFWGTGSAGKSSNKETNGMKNKDGVGVCDKRDECEALGTINDDGYIEVMEKGTPLWDEVIETHIISRSKCQLTLSATLVAALTAGAGLFLALQSKRK